MALCTSASVAQMHAAFTGVCVGYGIHMGGTILIGIDHMMHPVDENANGIHMGGNMPYGTGDKVNPDEMNLEDIHTYRMPAWQHVTGAKTPCSNCFQLGYAEREHEKQSAPHIVPYC